MPDLHHTLRSTDLDFIQRVARAWKIELSAQSFQSALTELETAVQGEAALREMLEFLPEPALGAWQYLLNHQGRESWAKFTREFGELRTFGLAKRARENPDLTPVSPVEILWYRGLIGRAFLKLSNEPQEYAYIPEEFLTLQQPHPKELNLLLPRPAAESECKVVFPANDSILDDMTEVLAALRMNRTIESAMLSQKPAYRLFLTALLSQVDLIAADRLPEPEKVKDFLSLKRGEALYTLFSSWQTSRQVNDLQMLPGLIFDGNWQNDPLLPRELLLSILKLLDPSTWWSISALLAQLKTQSPDFQRPAGDYDSWFIREEKTQKHLRGFENWDKVDGALVRYLLAGPLHWLGVLDVARAEKTNLPLSFRISPIGVELLKGIPPHLNDIEKGSITVLADGTLILERDVPRTLRYQLARFCLPVEHDKAAAKYRISPESLTQASTQGLRPTQLTQLLQQAKVKNIPQSVSDSLERWETYGSEVKIESCSLLRLEKPDLLPILQKTPRIARCLAEVLNSKTILIKAGSEESLRLALAEIGLLAEVKLDKVV